MRSRLHDLPAWAQEYVRTRMEVVVQAMAVASASATDLPAALARLRGALKAMRDADRTEE